MNDLTTLRTATKKALASRPDLQAEIVDLYQMAVCEIADGGSEANECDMAVNDIAALVSQ